MKIMIKFNLKDDERFIIIEFSFNIGLNRSVFCCIRAI